MLVSGDSLRAVWRHSILFVVLVGQYLIEPAFLFSICFLSSQKLLLVPRSHEHLDGVSRPKATGHDVIQTPDRTLPL